jgi:PAS domain S-box-containing protein
MLKNMSLKIKLVLTFLALAGLVGAASVPLMQVMFRVQHAVEDVVAVDFERLERLHAINDDLLEVEEELLRYRLDTKKDNAGEINELEEVEQKVQTGLNEYRALIKEDDEHAADAATLSVNIAQTLDKAEAVLELGPLATETQSNAAFVDFDTQQEGVEEDLLKAIGREYEAVEEEGKEVTAAISSMVTLGMGAVLFIAVAAVVLGIAVANSITKKIITLRQGAQALANGNFSATVPVKSGDEVGQLAMAFNQMAERLSESYRRIALQGRRDEIILESLGEGLIALDPEGKIVLINNMAAEMFELEDLDKAIGQVIEGAFTIYDEHDVVMPMNDHPAHVALREGKPLEDIYSFVRKDGKKILVYINASPVEVDDKISGAILVTRDVTKEKEVDRMKTEFISLASHQLRTPLSAIKWFTEMLVSGDAGKLNPEQLDFAKNVQDSTERMIELVNSLLNISRIESGRIIVDPKPTDLNVLVGGIVNDLKAKTAERQQTLVVSVHKDLPKINLDPRLIGQVYMNFLTNAIKYTPKGGEITVFISRKDDELVSQISDSGYGIPKAQQDKVFHKFFRADNVSKVETDGTGLGLYLVKAIIESSGGRVWFKSEEGKGTTFWFSLPMSGMKAREGEVTLDV